MKGIKSIKHLPHGVVIRWFEEVVDTLGVVNRTSFGSVAHHLDLALHPRKLWRGTFEVRLRSFWIRRECSKASALNLGWSGGTALTPGDDP